MNKRPLSITIIGCPYIVTGVIDFASHFKLQHPFQYDIVWVGVISLIAMVCGVYVLRGHNWARWLALAWIAFHVILSVFHPLRELAIHSLLLAVLAFFLFRRPATRYFRAG